MCQTMATKYLKTVIKMLILMLKYSMGRLLFMYVNLIGKIHGLPKKRILHHLKEGNWLVCTIRDSWNCISRKFSSHFLLTFLGGSSNDKYLNISTKAGQPYLSRYSWTQSETEELKKASLLLAADVIYSDDLTDAFFSILKKLMSDNPEKVPWMKQYSALLFG